MREDNIVRLRHMLDAANEAVGFVQGLTRADLSSDRKLVLALVKDIEIIGEAAFRFPNPRGNRLRTFHGMTSSACATDGYMPISILTRISFGKP